MPSICKYCNKPVILSPSASERAKKSDKPASYYTALFPNHSACEVAARSADSVALMRRINKERAATRVTYPLGQ